MDERVEGKENHMSQQNFNQDCCPHQMHWEVQQDQIEPAIFFSVFFKLVFLIYFFISWRLITLQYCSCFCHILTWISHGYTCITHPHHPSHLPLDSIPLGLPGAPGPSTCLTHPSWAGDLFHPRLLPQSPKVCFIHLCLFFCFAYRVIVTIFLNSIYMR